ncbi:hypothetical protein AB0M39_01890 [Streptomyces sp. NPDC051907]|uniref:hypothetical protein n=1 Tax=Streptomyces sp. NPDC051907 TaxID=3155284 RepID=UPI00341A648B
MTTTAVQQLRRHQEAKATTVAAADPRPQYKGLFLEPHYDIEAVPQPDAEIDGPHAGEFESLRY